MKFFIAMLFLLSTFTFFSEKSFSSQEAKYSVLRSDEKFQVRRYESHILAEYSVLAEFENAGSDAFRPLFEYISGNNTKSKTVSMTAPVSQQAGGQSISMTSPVGQVRKGEYWTVSFMMPYKYTLETIPQPVDKGISIRYVPERYIASIKYSGFWNEELYAKNYKKLKAWINNNQYLIAGEPIWARYNAPYTPWFLRRNEVLLPIYKPR